MADILWENRITDKNKIQDRFMFHRTKKTKIKDILQNGFKPRKSAKQEKKDERFLKKIAEVERSELLVDRTVSSFFLSAVRSS